MKFYLFRRFIVPGIVILILLLCVWFFHQYYSVDPDFLPGNVLTVAEYGFGISAPMHWRILRIPNSIMNYPQSAAQLIHESREAFCIVVPETVSEKSPDFSLEFFKKIVMEAVQKESSQAQFLSEQKVPSSWSERLRMEYESPQDLRRIAWLVQLDWAKKQTYRTLCWCKKENYPKYKADFWEICESVQPTR